MPDPDVGPSAAPQRTAPCVYLGHSALREFSTDSELGSRFARALAARGGTLALSMMNFLEYARVTDREQVLCAERFVDGVLPRVFFMDVSPLAVMRRATDYLARGIAAAPDADLQLFREVALQPGTQATSARGWFTGAAAARKTLAARQAELADNLLEAIAHLPERPDADVDVSRDLRDGAQRAHRIRATLAVLRALISTIQIERRAPLDRHDAIDLLHTVVPVSYCDYVLLDGRWCHLVERANTQLLNETITDLARVFSKRNKGLQRFLGMLEGAPETQSAKS
jgi:hypothetical protein